MRKQPSAGRRERIHDHVRTLVLSGIWRPGEKIQIASLAQRTNVSTTMVREALTALAGERLVVVRPNQGFFTPTLSVNEIADLTELRCRIETYALELAIERGGVAWEAEVIAAHHKLARADLDVSPVDRFATDEWGAAHREFHDALIRGSGLDRVCEIARSLADTTVLYRKWVVPTTQNEHRDVAGEHRALMDAVVSRQLEAAVNLLREHYTITLRQIEQHIADIPSAGV